MADKIVVMHDGIVEQMGAPLELYDQPANRFVAGFIGSPAMNFIDGTLRAGSEPYVETASGTRLALGSAPAASDGMPIVYGVRPEHFELGDGGIEAEVAVVEPTGSETQVIARLGTQDVIAVFRDRHPIAAGDTIKLRPRISAVHLFDTDHGRRLS